MDNYRLLTTELFPRFFFFFSINLRYDDLIFIDFQRILLSIDFID